MSKQEGELPVVAFKVSFGIHQHLEWGVDDLATRNDPLVDRSDAQAAIAKRDAEATVLRGLLREALELADNWPGIAYSEDLEKRARAALAQSADSESGGKA